MVDIVCLDVDMLAPDSDHIPVGAGDSAAVAAQDALEDDPADVEFEQGRPDGLVADTDFCEPVSECGIGDEFEGPFDAVVAVVFGITPEDVHEPLAPARDEEVASALWLARAFEECVEALFVKGAQGAPHGLVVDPLLGRDLERRVAGCAGEDDPAAALGEWFVAVTLGADFEDAALVFGQRAGHEGLALGHGVALLCLIVLVR